MADKIREEMARIMKTPHRTLDDCITEILSIKGIRVECENQELPDWKYYDWPDTRQSKEEMHRYQCGKITREQHEQQRRQCFDEEFAIYKKAQQDMLKEGWVKCEKEEQ